MTNEELFRELKGIQADIEMRIGKIVKKVEGGEPVAGWRRLSTDRSCKFLGYSKDGIWFDYGVNSSGEWEDDMSNIGVVKHIPLEEKGDVEFALVTVAENKGYENGQGENEINYNCLGAGGGRGTLEIVYDNFFLLDGELCHGELDDVNVVFSNGKWATIIEPKLTFGGHDVTVNDKAIFFNGGFIYLDTAHSIVDSNIEVFIMSRRPGVSFQVDELKELLTKIDKS